MSLENLINKRKDILFAEIGALIHDLGKLSKEFVESKSEDGNCSWFRHEDILKNNTNYQNFLTSSLKTFLNQTYSFQNLKNVITSYPNNITPVQKIGQFISKHDNGRNLFPIVILTPPGADGIDSAIDKMVADVSQSKQSKDNVYISTAFGYEKEKIDLNLANTDNNSLTKIREDYANKLADILHDLNNTDFSNTNLEIWIYQREKLLKETKKAFLKALGETRRPANDVSLWDHSFSVASLYKSALAEVVISGGKEPKEIKWKLLSIRFDGDEFYHSVNKISDVLGRKSLVEKIFENIKILLEVIIPIGNEIYRDENGSVFLVPETADDNKILEISDVWQKIKDFEIEAKVNFKGEWEKRKLDIIVKKIVHTKPANIKQLIESISSFISQGIFVPDIHVSKPSRGALNIGEEIAANKKHKIDVNYLQTKWQNKEKGYLKCSACGLRPVPITNKEKERLDEKIKEYGWKSLSEEEKNNYKVFERKVCIDCLKTATNRVEEWINNQKWNENEPEKPSLDTSIWLDEIADENNRVALVYISFDLEKWLSGEMLNTFLSKPLLDSEFKNSFENELENVNDYNQLVDLIKETFVQNDFDKELSVSKRDGNKLTVKELFQILGCLFQNGQKPLDVFKDIVENRESDWQDRYECPAFATKGDNYHKSIVFLLHLTRKHPSFARIRRVWETTKSLGIGIFKKAMEKLNKRERPVIVFTPNNSLQITHTYYFKDKNDTTLELVTLSNDKATMIINGNKFEVPESGKIELYDEGFKNVIATLENVQLSDSQKFYPLIPYQFEPSKTLFFMPLKYVWEVIKIIKEEYEIQFNKVQNRLPIRIGFVAFNKKMPMYVVLEAAKKIYSKKIEQKEFEVCRITEIPDDKNYKIKMSNGNEYHFSYSTGDPDKKDLFHPYFIVKNDNGWKIYFDKEWQTIKHVKTLEEEDKVLFYPSQFDFLWLDSNVRRSDVGEKRRHWLFKDTSPKPYNLKDIERFERLKNLLFNQLSLTSSQIMNLYEFLISKIQQWELDKVNLPMDDSAFKEFVENSILSVPLRLKISEKTKKGEITTNDFELLKNSILSGIFFDLIDMWHTILKRKFKEENNESYL